MPLKLSHLNLPARDPERLARWYEQQLGFERRGSYLVGPGTLIAFDEGQPIAAADNTHFGFQVDAPEEVDRWAQRFGTVVHSEPRYAATKVRDPEGNVFEIYWEPDGPRHGSA